MTPEIEAIKHVGKIVDGKMVCNPDRPSIVHKTNPKTEAIVEEESCCCFSYKQGIHPCQCGCHTQEHKKNIGMLRQWLNEDRITDPKLMVSNEDLLHWLKDTNA